MRRSLGLAILICSLLASASHAAIAVGQSRIVVSGTSEPNLAVSYLSNVAAGSTLIAFCSVFLDSHSVTNPTVSDSQTNTWTIRVNKGMRDSESIQGRLYIATAEAGASAANTVTCTPPGNAFITMVIAEITGEETASPIDQVASCDYDCNQPSTSALSGATAVTSQPRELIIAGMAYIRSSAITLSPVAPCAQLHEEEDAVSFATINVCADIVASAGTQQRTWTMGGSDVYYAGGIVTIKELAVVAGGGTRRVLWFH